MNDPSMPVPVGRSTNLGVNMEGQIWIVCFGCDYGDGVGVQYAS